MLPRQLSEPSSGVTCPKCPLCKTADCGRSDGVLNPGGVRFGSSDIYSAIESTFADEVADSLCVGQRRPKDADESVMLSLLMQSGKSSTPGLRARIESALKVQYGPRHVPKYIFETPAIPVSNSITLRGSIAGIRQLTSTGHHQRQQGLAAREADRIRQDCCTLRSPCQPQVARLLSSIRERSQSASRHAQQAGTGPLYGMLLASRSGR